MDNFKQASKERLRFGTSKGPLTVEQLWELSLGDLDTLAVSLEQEYKESGKKSFLAVKSEKDKTAKLRFDVCLEILESKKEEAEAARQKKERKEHNQKILSIISKKKDEALEGKSLKELEKMLQEED